MEEKKVITVWSPASRVGTTLTAISVAKKLTQKGLRVALMDFDLSSPSLALYFQSNNTVHGIDNLIPHLEGGTLTAEVLEMNLQEYEGVHYLRGTNAPEKSHFIHHEQLQKILEVAKQMFDHVVIDARGIIDNSGNFVALNGADLIYVVLDKDVISIQKYGWIKHLLMGNFDLEKFKLVVNKCHKDVFMETTEISDFTSLTDVYELPHMGFEFQNAVNQGKWMDSLIGNDKNSQSFSDAVDTLIENTLIGNFNELKEVKKSPFSFLRRR